MQRDATSWCDESRAVPEIRIARTHLFVVEIPEIRYFSGAFESVRKSWRDAVTCEGSWERKLFMSFDNQRSLPVSLFLLLLRFLVAETCSCTRT